MSPYKPLAEAVQAAATSAVAQRAAAWKLATVTAVNTGGTLDIKTALGPIAGVRRLKGYTSPAVGNVVMVVSNADGNWIVVDALATS